MAPYFCIGYDHPRLRSLTLLWFMLLPLLSFLCTVATMLSWDFGSSAEEISEADAGSELVT